MVNDLMTKKKKWYNYLIIKIFQKQTNFNKNLMIIILI
jgi:hypothetical protein